MSSRDLVMAAAGGSTAANYIEDVFSTYLYTGAGTAQTITNNIDLSTKGGLVWIKNRGTGTTDHQLVDTARGAYMKLASDITNGQANTAPDGISAFNTDGFSIGGNYSLYNTSGNTYASWTFRKQPKFFDVVTYTGTGSVQNIAHSLGSVPGCIIVKSVTANFSWATYHRSNGNTGYLALNTTAAVATSANIWGSTTPTSTQFTVGADTWTNRSGDTYVAYIFAHDAGGFGLAGTDNVISCGSYTGTGAAGLAVTLGYEPQWVMIKRTDIAGQEWAMLDSMRGLVTGTGGDSQLFANTSDAETTGNTYVAATATGFQLETAIARYNASGGTYIYIAIRRGPMKVPTDGTTVFKTDVGRTAASGATPAFISNFVTDLGFVVDKSTAGNKEVASRLTGATRLRTNTTDAEAAQAAYTFDYQIGWNSAGSDAPSQVSWMFQRAPNFFDEVCYTGTGSTNQVITHNLGVTPELIITKNRSTASTNWLVYSSTLGVSKYLLLQSTAASASGSAYVSVSSSTYTVNGDGTWNGMNGSGAGIVSYLFASCPGVSKVFSYSGTGATQTISCGFTGGARFVLIKRTDSTGDWYVWDTARGMVAGTDPSLLLNSTAAEVNANSIYTTTGGFQIVSTAAGINASGGSYIGLAVA